MKTKKLIIGLIVFVVGLGYATFVFDMYFGSQKIYSFSVMLIEYIYPSFLKNKTDEASQFIGNRINDDRSAAFSPTTDNVFSSEFDFPISDLNISTRTSPNTQARSIPFRRTPPDLLSESSSGGSTLYAFRIGGSRSGSAGSSSGGGGVIRSALSSPITPAFAGAGATSTQPTILVDPMNDPSGDPLLPVGDGKYFLIVLATGYLLLRIRKR